MIAYLRGILAEKDPHRVVVECAGVGYETFISLSTFDRLPAEGAEVKLFTYHALREDDERLYGFATEKEKGLFEMVTGVSGVGPKMALGILSGMSSADLMLAISQGDAKRLSNIKGIGRKTAERIVVELKDKVNPIEAAAGAAAGDDAQALRDAMLALTALGFSDEVARDKVQAALSKEPHADTETLVRLALAGK